MLIYDGDCRFCTSSAEWLRARLPADQPIVAYQAVDLGRFGLTEADAAAAAYWVDAEGSLHRGAAAIAAALVVCGGAWGIVGRGTRQLHTAMLPVPVASGSLSAGGQRGSRQLALPPGIRCRLRATTA